MKVREAVVVDDQMTEKGITGVWTSMKRMRQLLMPALKFDHVEKGDRRDDWYSSAY